MCEPGDNEMWVGIEVKLETARSVRRLGEDIIVMLVLQHPTVHRRFDVPDELIAILA